MAITPDIIIDRMRLKKQLINWRLLALVALFLLVASLFTGKEMRKFAAIDGEYIARVFIDGEIFDDFERLENLKKIAESKHIKAVIMHVNSPGGTAVGGEGLYNAVLNISKNKPVVTVMGDLAASAAYMTAIASDHLIAHQSTLTGSIGVIAMTYEFTDLADKLGVKFHNLKSAPLKGGPLPTEKMTPEMERAMNETISDTYHMFLEMVAERRKIDPNQLLAIADGRVYTGRQAIKLGLIDEIGDEATALKWLHEQKGISDTMKIYDYQLLTPESKIDRFLVHMQNFGDLIKILTNANLSYFL